MDIVKKGGKVSIPKSIAGKKAKMMIALKKMKKKKNVYSEALK